MYEVQGGKDYQNLLGALNTFSKTWICLQTLKYYCYLGGWGWWMGESGGGREHDQI